MTIDEILLAIGLGTAFYYLGQAYMRYSTMMKRCSQLVDQVDYLEKQIGLLKWALEEILEKQDNKKDGKQDAS